MGSKFAILSVAGLLTLGAQELPLDLQNSVKIDLPSNSPVTLLSANLGGSHATPRGSAMVVDLQQMVLSLRNAGDKHIRGVTLLVTAQEVTPGGRGSVTLASLDVPPGGAFPVHIDLRLLRPAQLTAGPLVQVSLDGVLFGDLSFYGPNRLDSRRAMTAWELEAQRDRRYFKTILSQRGPEGLRSSALESLVRQAERPRLDVQVVRGRSVSAAGVAPEHVAKFAFLEFPDSPVKPVEGWAQLAGSEARSPRIQVENRSGRSVRYVEIGWLVKDSQGREFMAASVPAGDPDLYLPPGRSGRVLQDAALKFSRGGQPVNIAGMTAFVSQVEFADGQVWIPNRESLAGARLLGVLAPSPEEQRLTDLYRKKGLDALIRELQKFE
ncbi:MAG TPA: hypothetical protein VFA33_07255 [Bryobacteraceae bacterium]|nr:hypothetical protein [Bryobacteraceae bacterium]